MLEIAFEDQKVDLSGNANNQGLQRKEDVEKWTIDMYSFISKNYGEDKNLSFIVHLDEKNL